MADQANVDPLALWRDWVANSERQWNGFLNNAMATDEFSQTMGRMMDVYLNVQKQMNEVMGRYLQVINVPTRNDVMAIGERLSQIEDRLVSIEDALMAARRAGPAAETVPPASGAAATVRPPRTKKPAKS
ncbi:MAG: poly(R)-hydroxyalkanoic acid synthase subunit PhaE [Dehalococcoidia bacterium]